MKRLLDWLCAHNIHPWYVERYIECGCWDQRCVNCNTPAMSWWEKRLRQALRGEGRGSVMVFQSRKPSNADAEISRLSGRRGAQPRRIDHAEDR